MEKLTGNGRPSPRFKGEVGQHYEDLLTGDIYECRIAQEYSPTHGWPVGGYVWELRAKGEDIQDGLMGGNPSWNDITDKPFGSKSICLTRFDDWEFSNSAASPLGDISLTIGKEYIVEFDGDVYAVIATEAYNGAAQLGDYTYADYPFRVRKDNDFGCFVINARDAGAHTGAIYAEEVVTLNTKFLPKATAVADAAGETVTGTEFNALLTALRNAGYLNT